MSDTPRTDQYVKMRASLAYCVERDTSDFARILERELAKVTKQRDELVKAIRGHKSAIAFTLSDFDEELYKALEELEQGGCAVSNTPRTDECWEDGDCNILLHARQLERELADVTESLRKAIVWAEAASHRITDRQNINWTYLNEARGTLAAMQNGGAV